ncbi:MAG: extracellular solute-binding protein [Anaerolineae bacterium]|nr:extracellular solute-binding protein [Anaerolineae bacterium]
MVFRPFLSKCVILALVFAMVPAPYVQAQDNTVALKVSIPDIWEDVLTADILAEFESAHPGVKLYVTFSNTNFFGFGGTGGAVDDRLDDTQELVTSADVLYIDPTSLTVEDTQAGYFLDIAPLVMNDPALNAEDFLPAVWQSYQWDNGIWALPLSADIILMTYDPAAFDAVGLAYPNERWTIDDFANAARLLATYNADGTVATPGLSTNTSGSNLSLLLRLLAGQSLYDSAAMSSTPDFTNPALASILQTWYDLAQEGVVSDQRSGPEGDAPLRIEGIDGYARRQFRPNEDTAEAVYYASLLPGGVAGLGVQGFAVSAGTQYPELAYELAKFLILRPELASNNFSAAPARYDMASATQTTNSDGGPGGEPGGGPGGPGGFGGANNIPEEIQPTVDQAQSASLPVAELRYASYLSVALTEMANNGGDAQAALQTAEAQAFSDMQTAAARYGTTSLFITPPDTGPVLAPGEIALTCAVNAGMGGGFGGRQLFNQDEWDRIIADFVASDPLVGDVVLEATNETDLATLAEQYDCFILSSNVVPGSDLSPILNLDPLLDTDLTFDRNDVIGNTLVQVQQDGKTWALPLAVQPQMLEYDSEQFAWAGVPEPVNGWTADAFVDALRMLKPYDEDPAPFNPNDPSGAYLMMLIGAFGGLPIDYRTDPPTMNFTDPATVEAIRQVLDLAVDGYITYSSTSDSMGGMAEMGEDIAITTGTFNQFRRPGRPGEDSSSLAMTTYPQGSVFNVIAYEITTGYISAITQNPDATYRFLSLVSLNPQLFSGMPARGSLVGSAAVLAAQGEDVVEIYQQLDALMDAPNTIVFPTFTMGRGASVTNFIQEYWLKRAFDHYVLEGADLDYELSEAEMYTNAYLECTQGIVLDETGESPEQMRAMFQQIAACATGVDPTFSLFGGE